MIEGDGGYLECVLDRAQRAEAAHFRAAGRAEPDGERDSNEVFQELVDHCACALVLAALGAAVHYACEHPEDTTPDLRNLVNEATWVVSNLPPRLDVLWEVHYVEGRSLAEYAASAGVDARAAYADYWKTIATMSRAFHVRHLEQRHSSVREVSAHGPSGVTCGLY
jgi:hypothetical protein